MSKPDTAYDIKPEYPLLTPSQKRQAILWWQQHTPYTRLTCPTCGAVLELGDVGIELQCPQAWCHFSSDEIPWVVYASWHRSGKTPV